MKEEEVRMVEGDLQCLDSLGLGQETGGGAAGESEIPIWQPMVSAQPSPAQPSPQPNHGGRGTG